MQRNSVIAEIFGFIIGLAMVAIFFASIAGIVNSAFRVANPSAPQRIFIAHIRGVGPNVSWMRRGPNVFWMQRGSGMTRPSGRFMHPGAFGRAGAGRKGRVQYGPVTASPSALPTPAPGAQPLGMMTATRAGGPMMRGNAASGARYDAIRRLVLSIIMLIVSTLVFRRLFAWLQPRQTYAS